MESTENVRERLEGLAYEGILAEVAIVEVFEDGRWVGEASGSSVAWLVGAYDVAAEMFARVRIVTRYGQVLVGPESRWLKEAV